MQTLRSDLRLAIRQAIQRPAFTILVVGTLSQQSPGWASTFRIALRSGCR